MQTKNSPPTIHDRIVDISRATRQVSIVFISIAMFAITANFYFADEVFARASVLPIYIFFFMLMYVLCMLVEYMSLWCKRDKGFHYMRVSIHALALFLVTLEIGSFYGSGRDVYTELPSYSLTQALSQMVVVPSVTYKKGI